MTKKKEEGAPPRKSIREKLLGAPSSYRQEIYESGLGAVVFRQPGFKTATMFAELEGVDRIVCMLMRCLFNPVLDADGHPVIGEDGQPLAGKPVFEAADEEYLKSTDHDLDGWFVEIVKALDEFVARGVAGAEVGKP